MRWERDGRACTKNVKHLWGENWMWEKKAQGIRSVSEGDHAPFSASTPHAPSQRWSSTLAASLKTHFSSKKDCCLCCVFT